MLTPGTVFYQPPFVYRGLHVGFGTSGRHLRW
jgi:hypothetical protein